MKNIHLILSSFDLQIETSHVALKKKTGDNVLLFHRSII